MSVFLKVTTRIQGGYAISLIPADGRFTKNETSYAQRISNKKEKRY